MQRKAPHTVNFTKQAIEKLPVPPDARVYHYDEKIPGLAVCVTPAGTRTFYVVRRVGHTVERIKIGGWPEYTVEMARNEATKLNGKVADGINPNEQRRADRRVWTLGEAFDAFLLLPTRTKAKRPRSPKTLHDYRQQFAAYLERWRQRRLVQISRADVEALHDDLGTANGFVTANRVLTLLRAIYNASIEAGYTGINPTQGIRKFEEQSRERFLHADELPKFWMALEAEKSEKVKDFVKLALFTGQRRGNVAAMRWADTNLERAVWSIPKVKGGKPHVVPLSGVAVEILNNRKAECGDSEYVFPGRHGRGHLKDPMRMWRELLERAGIENLRIHDLRRSLGSWQTSTGASLSIVGKTLGHTRPETTAIYSRLEMQPVRDAVETATTAIMAAATAKPKGPSKAKKGRDHGKA